MIKELTAAEAKQQTLENLKRNVVFEAIDCESKLGRFEFTISTSYVDESTVDYLREKGYKVENKESRGKNYIYKSYRISWI